MRAVPEASATSPAAHEPASGCRMIGADRPMPLPLPTGATLVMPNYNHSRYLPTSLRGVLGQTRPADRVVIVDDASDDDSLAIIRRLAEGRPNVSIIANAQRMGVIAVMNREIERCQTPFIAFSAADDFLAPDFVEASTAALEAAPRAAFSAGCATIRDENWKVIGERPILRPRTTSGYVAPEAMRGLLRRGDNFFLGAAILYRQSALAALGGFDAAVGPACDAMLQRRMAVRDGFAFIARPLAVWRIHGDNYSITAQQHGKAIVDLCAALGRIVAREPEGLFPPDYAALLERRMRFAASRQLLLRQPSDADAYRTIALLMGPGRVDSLAMALLTRLGPLATTALLAWMTLRLRPFSLGWLLKERLAARLLRPLDHAG